jgi:hypothetical protein
LQQAHELQHLHGNTLCHPAPHLLEPTRCQHCWQQHSRQDRSGGQHRKRALVTYKCGQHRPAAASRQDSA